MKIAETVTFGSSGLDRAAQLRGQAEVLSKEPTAQYILFWRGKPLVEPDAALVRVGHDHPVLADMAEAPIFLGRDDGRSVFAADLSAWEPAETDPVALDSFLDRTQQQHPELPNGHVFSEIRGLMTQFTPRDAELAATAKAILGWHISHRFCARCGQESAVAMAGWQRDCAACGGHHFPRTDPVVIMLITHGNSVLVGRSPGWPEGMYSLLAGFVEPGETIEAAVRREVFEESGVTVGEVNYLASQPWPFPASLMIGCSGEAKDTKLTIDPEEIEDAMWVTREDIALAFSGNHPKMLPARKGAIAHFLLENWLADRLD